jgi:hypothetical protein
MDGSQAVAPRAVAADPGVELVVERHQDGVGLVGEFGHAGEDILGLGAVDEPAAASSS